MKIDHGADMLKIHGEWIEINSIGAVDIGVEYEPHEKKVESTKHVMSESGDSVPINVEVTCKTKGHHLIEANTQRLVEFELQSPLLSTSGLCLFVGADISVHGCLIAKSVHRVNAAKLYCNVMNTSASHIRLKDKVFVGKLSACSLASDVEMSAQCNPINSDKKVHFEDDPRMDEEKLRIQNVESLKMGKNLAEAEVIELRKILLKNYDCFAWDEETLGRTEVLVHKVPTGDHPSIRQRQYAVPTVAQEAMREQVEEMLKKKVIRESNSDWCSPVLLIKKILPDGSTKYRFCIDLRMVNDATTKDCYSIPRIDETVDALSGAKFFSAMDVDRAFWQIAMDEADKHKFAFRVDGRLYEPNVMPFGSKNASSTFQRLMDKVLRGLTWKQCLVYIDDILVFANTFSEHCKRLDAVLTELRRQA